MGKHSKKKKNGRPNPSSIKTPYSTVTSEMDENNDSEDTLLKIANNLKAGSSIEKECGCSSLAMVAETKVDVILERKLPRIAAPLILDKDDSVSHSAIGALVNISLMSPDICEQLVSQDVMTPLCRLLTGKYASHNNNSWNRKTVANTEVVDQREEIFIKAVTLLWNLCEASETALSIVNAQNVIQVLFSYMDTEKYSIEVVACVLQCIYSLCENNMPAIAAIKERGVERLFGNLLKPEKQSVEKCKHANGGEFALASILYLRILASGITMSVLNDSTDTTTNAIDCTVSSRVLHILIETSSTILDQDHRKLIHDYTSLIPLADDDLDENKIQSKSQISNGCQMETEDKKSFVSEEFPSLASLTEINSMRTIIHHVLLGQQMTCEILTNLCCDPEQDVESLGESDEMELSDEDDDVCHFPDETNINASNAKEISSGIPPVVLEAFISHNLVSKVLSKANFPAENACEILKGANAGKPRDKFGGSTILKMLSTLRSRAFLCVNNMLGSDLTVEDLGGADSLFEVWSNLGLLCFQDAERNLQGTKCVASSDELELVESVTSAMRATTQKLSEARCHEPFSKLQQPDVLKMIDFGSVVPEANIRINFVQIIGNIGALSILPEANSTISQNSNLFAKFLLDAASKDSDIRVVSEALDKIFDMFSEDYTDELCTRINLVSQLKKIVPTLKIKIGLIKKGKRQEVEQNMLPVVDIAKTNLIRFIKYKEQRPKLMNGHSNVA